MMKINVNSSDSVPGSLCPRLAFSVTCHNVAQLKKKWKVIYVPALSKLTCCGFGNVVPCTVCVYDEYGLLNYSLKFLVALVAVSIGV